MCNYLCNVYAKATRSVSIPAPVYCEYCIGIPRQITHVIQFIDADVSLIQELFFLVVMI